MNTRDQTKRIPKSIGTEAQLFGNYTLTDITVGLLPGVVVLLFMQVVVPSSLTIGGYSVQSVTLPLAGLAIGLGGVFVYLTPPYTTSLDWLETILAFYGRTHEQTYDEAKPHTQVERVHPREGVIELVDGSLLGMVQVTPPSMALATTEEWKAAAQGFQNFLNTTIEYPIQIYSTTQQFPTESYVARYADRLEDPDVRANPLLASLIEHYIAWYEVEMEQRWMTIRDHYIVVPVTPAEVQFEHESLGQKLAALPVLGPFVQAVYAPRREEERIAMGAALEERLHRIEVGIRELEDCSAERIEVAEMVSLLTSFWHGRDVPAGSVDDRVRTRDIVGGVR